MEFIFPEFVRLCSVVSLYFLYTETFCSLFSVLSVFSIFSTLCPLLNASSDQQSTALPPLLSEAFC